MADEKRPSGAAGGKRRRPPTTIDLKATEIAPESVKPTEHVDPPAENQATPERGPEAAPESPPQPGASAGSRGWRERLDLAVLNARMSALRGRFALGVNWRLIAAAGAGAAAMLILFLAFWGFGAFNTRDDPTAKLAARLAVLEQQVRDVANRPQPAALDQRTLADLAARVGAAEAAVARLPDFDARLAKAEAAAGAPRAAQPDQALTARVAALEAAVRPLAELRQAVDAAAVAAREGKARADAAFEAAQKIPAPQPPAVALREMEALSARVTALEQAAKSAEDTIARTAGADRAGRLAFVAVALRSAVERGEPFERELAATKPLVADAKLLAPLEPFAATGVPRSAALARELSQLTGPMLAAAGGAPRDGGIFDRLQQNAERLVRVRPINEAPGDDPATVVTRAEVKATHGDLSGALAELGSLPVAVRAPAEAWMKKVQAQIAALTAARRLADGAIATLGKAAP